jgi:hypothetical protein
MGQLGVVAKRGWDGRKAEEADQRFSEPFVWFIRLLFVVIIGNGFRTFTANVSLEKLVETPTLILLTTTAYFIAGYFFVIADFIFYQFQIVRYPYPQRTVLRFFEDIVIFFLLFLLLNFASIWPSPRTLMVFILLLCLWYLWVMLWQLHVNKQYGRVWTRGITHAVRFTMYMVVFILYMNAQQWKIPPVIAPGPELDEAMKAVIRWVWLVTVLIGVSNAIRLYSFTRPDWWLVRQLRYLSGAAADTPALAIKNERSSVHPPAS